MLQTRIKSFSERSLISSSRALALQAGKKNTVRGESVSEESKPKPKKGVSWSSIVQLIRPSQQRNSILRNYQKRLSFNDDTKVATLEFIIMILSLTQLHMSYQAPHWRENRACLSHPDCVVSLSDGSFEIANYLRFLMAALAVVRLCIRIRHIWKKKRPYGVSATRSRLINACQYAAEILYIVIFPYPGLEQFIPGHKGQNFVGLSVAVLLRTISWGQWLYFPYPIRQKEKVASFSGNLEFSYRKFVVKKVLDDNPLTKVATFYLLLGILSSYMLHIIETIKAECTWPLENSQSVLLSEDAVCDSLSISDANWLTFTTFLSIGYGHVLPKTSRGRLVVGLSASLAVCLDAMFYSIIIKKFNFSSMEARVHAFLYRMELHNKKDLSAVMAVQSCYRFSKSYKRSLIWHQQPGSNVFYRPLSARLPNEVKKKLYASRFQASLKQIIKYNTDGDPLNSFTKHIEVITAALGATFIDMIRLKKVYYRRSRTLQERNQRVPRRANSFVMASDGHPMLERPASGALSPSHAFLTPRNSDMTALPKALPSSLGNAGNAEQNSQLRARAGSSTTVTAAWGDEMLRKCEATMALLKKIETNAQSIQQHHAC